MLPQSINKLPGVRVAGETTSSLKGHSDKEIKKVCADFEAMFIKQMLETMRKSMSNGGFFGARFQGDIYTTLFEDQLSKVLSEGKGIGIGKELYKNLVHRYGNIKDEKDK
ncbi:MAG: rod-binding protein [Dissulfurimicrobium sp.]|uniref:rod-binding protein n=1 Tax=Dissulfurimicrobium TaxID=1769732 RepID=UPI001EDA7A34|nr:rod-binding protein [Dissulfurimicrobium hydrothermale]UKL13713.1 rod-binding protein [Dissulfurimicrobium hydrothermale]